MIYKELYEVPVTKVLMITLQSNVLQASGGTADLTENAEVWG